MGALRGRLLKLLAFDFDVTQQDESNYCRWTTLGLPRQANYRLWQPQGPTKEVQNKQHVLVCSASNIKNIYQWPGMPLNGHVKSELTSRHSLPPWTHFESTTWRLGDSEPAWGRRWRHPMLR